MFFFVSIIIGGRGSILGPFIGTVVLTALPELASPLAKLGTFFYGLLLLAVVLLVPEGVGASVQKLVARFRPGVRESHVVTPDLALLATAITRPGAAPSRESLVPLRFPSRLEASRRSTMSRLNCGRVKYTV